MVVIMTLSDDVRKYCFDNYISPARKRGDGFISIRAGDIHKEMNFKKRMPLVCSSLGTKKFEELTKVERISITGPLNGASTTFTFKL